MGGSRSHSGKKLENCPKIVQYYFFLLGQYTMCIFLLYMLLKVASHYHLRVLHMLVMGFRKKSLDRGWVELVQSNSFQFFYFCNCASP